MRNSFINLKLLQMKVFDDLELFSHDNLSTVKI